MESEKCFRVSPAKSSGSGKSPILKTRVQGGDPVLKAKGGQGECRLWKQMHNQVPGARFLGAVLEARGPQRRALPRSAGKKAGIVLESAQALVSNKPFKNSIVNIFGAVLEGPVAGVTR